MGRLVLPRLQMRSRGAGRGRAGRPAPYNRAVAIKNNEHWLALVDTFQSAALGERTWDAALEGLAGATGSRGTQLIGRKRDLSVLFNVMTGVDPAVQKRAIELQPLNPRPPVVERAPLLRLVADWDVIRLEDARRNPFYQEVLVPADAPFFCGTVIERREDLFVTLGVVRSHADGYITPEQRGALTTLAPHVRSAIRLQTALEGKSARLLAECMDVLSIPLFICDSLGRIRALSRAAESLVTSGRGLELRNRRLRAARVAETRDLDDAIALASAADRTPGAAAARTVVIRGSQPADPPMALEVFALPSRLDCPLSAIASPRVLIVARGSGTADGRRSALLGALYRLTAAEVEVAHQLAAGKSIADIASDRQVSIGTVRVQTKAVLGKMGLRRQAELVARLSRL